VPIHQQFRFPYLLASYVQLYLVDFRPKCTNKQLVLIETESSDLATARTPLLFIYREAIKRSQASKLKHIYLVVFSPGEDVLGVCHVDGIDGFFVELN